MTEKYTGPMGFVITDVKEVKDPNWEILEPFLKRDGLKEGIHWKKSKRKPGHKVMRGIIENDPCIREAVFEVLEKTGKLDGIFAYIGPNNLTNCDVSKPETMFRQFFHYLNGTLHGYAFCFSNDLATRVYYYYRGKTDNYKEREQKNKKTRDIRKLFSDASVMVAIKTGDPVKIKNAMTRAIIGTSKRRKSKGMDE